jgi:hypothetical protein
MRAILLVNMLAALGAASAFAQPPLPPNTINCEDFTQRPDGTWYVAKRTTFDIGPMKGLTLTDQAIGPHAMNVAGVDLYDAITRKCGGDKT